MTKISVTSIFIDKKRKRFSTRKWTFFSGKVKGLKNKVKGQIKLLNGKC